MSHLRVNLMEVYSHSSIVPLACRLWSSCQSNFYIDPFTIPNRTTKRHNFARAQFGSIFVLRHHLATASRWCCRSHPWPLIGQGNEGCPPLIQIRERSERKNGEKTRWYEWARAWCSFNVVVVALVYYTRWARVARGRNLSISTMGFCFLHRYFGTYFYLRLLFT